MDFNGTQRVEGLNGSFRLYTIPAEEKKHKIIYFLTTNASIWSFNPLIPLKS